MEKLPVGDTISATYGFVFRNYLRILGIVWFPVLLMLGAYLAVLGPMMGRMAAAARANDPAAMANGLGLLLLIYPLSMLLLLMLNVGVTRLALDRKPAVPFFFFTLGRDFWRLLLATIVLVLLVIVAAIALNIVLGIIGAAIGATAAGGSGNTVGSVLLFTLVMLFVTYAAMIFVMVRFGMLLSPVVISEEGLGLARAWSLSRGNFWRLFATLVVAILPLLAIVFVFFMVAMASTGGMPVPSRNPNAGLQWSAGMFQFYTRFALIYIPVSILIAPINYGLLFGAGAFAYRALNPAASSRAADVF